MTGAPDGAPVLDTTTLSNFSHVDDVELLDLPRPVTVNVVESEFPDGVDSWPYLVTSC